MSRSTTTLTSCLVFMTAVACLPTPPEDNECENSCYKILSPVCGSDGQSYANECIMNNTNCFRNSGNPVTKVKNGYCEEVQDGCPMSCPFVEQLVCGSDGVTYTTPCGLRRANCRKPVSEQATLAYMGKCVKPSFSTPHGASRMVDAVIRDLKKVEGSTSAPTDSHRS